jgi:hypothetical protein
MKHRILIAIGSALLFIGGAGVIVTLAWLTAGNINGSLSYTLDQRIETLIYVLPTLMLVVAIAGAGFLASAISIPPREVRTARDLHPHLRFHG